MTNPVFPSGSKMTSRAISAETDFAVSAAEGMRYSLTEAAGSGDLREYSFSLGWTSENRAADDAFLFQWDFPATEVLYRWTTGGNLSKALGPDWEGMQTSDLVHGAPVVVLFNGKSESVYSFAVSECKRSVSFHAGINEESGRVFCRVSLPVKQFASETGTGLTLRISARRQPVAGELRCISRWWETTCGMPALPVPEASRKPLYSFWYSFHWDFDAARIEDECRRARDLGFETCILDGGWVADVISRGLSYAGDWIPSPKKLGDMAAHVARVHAIGMKYMLWFAVPCVGSRSEAYALWKDRGIGECLGSVVADPRYPEYRAHIIRALCVGVREWGLDGVKLDFVDCLHESDVPFGPGMDTPSVLDAAQRLMEEIAAALRAINPDVLIEFRQNYTGPMMRGFGNIFRVADCPFDYIKNRVGILDLRMLMGESAVHSDMLMWHGDLAPELAALQLISCLFGVVQYSVKLSGLDEHSKRMSRFILDFMREHRELLASDSLTVYDPQLNYTRAKVCDDAACIAAVYAPAACVKPDDRPEIFLWNGSEYGSVLAELPCRPCRVEVFDCCGSRVNELALPGGLTALPIPVGGMAKITRG